MFVLAPFFFDENKAKALFTALKSGELSYFAEGLSVGELTLYMEYATADGSIVGSDAIKIVVGRIELEPVTIEGGPSVPPANIALPYNSCGIETGKTANFAIKVEPASIANDKIEWSVKSGSVSFENSNDKGRTVTVKGNGTGKAKLEISIPGHKGPLPQIDTEVLDKKTVKAFIYIVRKNDGSDPATTEQNVTQLLSQVNEIYKQVAIEFVQQPVEYIDKTVWLDISTSNNWAEFYQLTSEHQKTGGIELYFIDTIDNNPQGTTGANKGPGFGALDGLVITDAANFRTVGHEMGHAGTLNDIYVSEGNTTLTDDPVKESWLKDDWNNGPSPQYYNSSLKQKELIPRLLMFGRPSTIKVDISSGKVHGIDRNGVETEVKVGNIKTPSHD